MDSIYKELVNLPGAPSFEKPVRDYMRKHLKQTTEEILEDRLGSIFGVINKGSTGPKVMLAGHMDEVGAIVTSIKDNGLIKISNLGGVKGNVYLSQHFDIYTDDGEKIPAISASKPPHLSRGDIAKPKELKFTDLLLDIGADDKKHAEQLGVKIGQQVISRNDYTVSKDGKKFFSKAWDDRFGCGISLEVARDIKKENLNCELYTGATVQEEVGLRGAKTAAGLIKPDLFIAVDCSPCADVFDGDESSGSIGDGFLLRFFDPSAIMHQGMKKHIIDLAKKHNIKFQYYRSKGGTDAARIQLENGGTLVATIGMPARYIHSTTSMISEDDYKEVKKIVFALIKSIDNDTIKTIKENV
ncbi:MAG: M42 family metallopeptidase [Candidatus Izimaplasma sp.]|nr:M42 family metallopeptidase [Candidatus Izimaplasma bacterium]